MNLMTYVKQTYSIIISDESQKAIGFSYEIFGAKPSMVKGPYDVVIFSISVAKQQLKL